jgi:hypothetical protein
MKEVRCVVLEREGNYTGPHKIVPYRVLVPECEGVEPEHNVEGVLNHIADIGYNDTVVTKFVDGLGEQLWGLVDWDNVPVSAPATDDADEAWTLFDCMSHNGRIRELEPIIASDDTYADRYMNRQPRESWVNWTDEELSRSPAWLFKYAQQVMKGKLPENLHAAMMMHSYRAPENGFVKRYFKMRRYKYSCKKNLRVPVSEVA